MAPAEGPITVDVVYSPAAGQVDEARVTLAPGATVAQALAQSALLTRHPELQGDALTCGVWSQRCELTQTLRDQDRVEVYRPLQVDPKESRRRRQVRNAGRPVRGRPAK